MSDNCNQLNATRPTAYSVRRLCSAVSTGSELLTRTAPATGWAQRRYRRSSEPTRPADALSLGWGLVSWEASWPAVGSTGEGSFPSGQRGPRADQRDTRARLAAGVDKAECALSDRRRCARRALGSGRCVGETGTRSRSGAPSSAPALEAARERRSLAAARDGRRSRLCRR